MKRLRHSKFLNLKVIKVKPLIKAIILNVKALQVPMVRLLGVDPYIINNEYYSSSQRLMAQPHYDVATGSRLYVGTSREALEDPELKDPWASIDLLFIDADHSATAVLEDR